MSEDLITEEIEKEIPFCDTIEYLDRIIAGLDDYYEKFPPKKNKDDK